LRERGRCGNAETQKARRVISDFFDDFFKNNLRRNMRLAGILAAGYTMFFTSSLLIFFFSYEMLLIPSFFILYNFAKTRKCVEAAYLMFF
jgi:NADH:ubiquinone oxidoreductase subunit 4 (subunit M)